MPIQRVTTRLVEAGLGCVGRDFSRAVAARRRQDCEEERDLRTAGAGKGSHGDLSPAASTAWIPTAATPKLKVYLLSRCTIGV